MNHTVKRSQNNLEMNHMADRQQAGAETSTDSFKRWLSLSYK